MRVVLISIHKDRVVDRLHANMVERLGLISQSCINTSEAVSARELTEMNCDEVVPGEESPGTPSVLVSLIAFTNSK